MYRGAAAFRESRLGAARIQKGTPKDHMDEIVIVILHFGQHSDTNPAFWTIFGRDSDTNPRFWTK